MKVRSYVLPVMLASAVLASAQVAAHAPVGQKPASKATPDAAIVAMASKVVARVNGAALTEIDLKREMFAIFPYAQQHNGFPKDMEPQIRKGALEMIIFEELLYQEAKRRNLTVPPERIASAQTAFRKQFSSSAAYEQYMQSEMKGSTSVLKEKIRRSLLIESMLKTEVSAKAAVTPVEVKAFYDKNPKQFEHGETFRIQTISILPPQNGGADIANEARKRADDAVRQAKVAKNYQEFGVLAEKMSDDDWHVNMGDRKTVEASTLPPEVVKAARALKPGQVSDLIQLGSAYTVLRLVEHSPAGKTPFAEAKAKLQSDLRKQKTQQVRAALGEKLRKSAKIEIL